MSSHVSILIFLMESSKNQKRLVGGDFFLISEISMKRRRCFCESVRLLFNLLF